MTLDLDFDWGSSTERPFSLDIADAMALVDPDLADVFSSIVAADASGNLTAEASIELALLLGLDL